MGLSPYPRADVIITVMRLRPLLLFLTSLLIATLPATAQTGGGHILFGDLKVDERKAPDLGPQTFQVILYTLDGRVVARQTVSSNGRYRFLDVGNGDYYLVVEMGTEEVARLQLLLMERVKSDIRRDIELEWLPEHREAARRPAATVSVKDFYNRSKENAARLEQALNAGKRNDHARSAALLQEVVAADRRDFEAWTELGTANFKLARYTEAEQCYRRALQESPGFVLALMNLGKLQITRRDFEAAAGTLMLVVDLDPALAEAHSLLGESYLQVRKGSKAEVHFKEALRLDPAGQAEAHLRLAALYNAAGLKEMAAAEYERFLSRRPDHPEKEKLLQYIRQNRPQQP
jgi:tetratricopeptide (TPR) repeat protein